MLNLFKLAREYDDLYNALLETADEETGETDVDISKALAAAQGTFEEKAVATATVYRKLCKASADIDEEIKRMQALKKHADKQADRVKQYLSDACRVAGIESIKGVYANISFRKSEQTVIDDERLLPEEFITVKTTYTPDKTKIKAAIKAGEDVQGAHIETVNNIQIK